jgi:hypothetical protein
VIWYQLVVVEIASDAVAGGLTETHFGVSSCSWMFTVMALLTLTQQLPA